MTKDECINLGSISKTHGVRGELILRTKEGSFEPEEKWESLFLEIDGIMVPFFISEFYHLRDRDWVVSFDDMIDKNGVKSLIGRSVWISKDLFKSTPDKVIYDQLVDFTFHDKASGKSGTIREFLDIPGNPVLNAEIEGENHMIPLQEGLIVDLDIEKKSIVMNLPEGLI